MKNHIIGRLSSAAVCFAAALMVLGASPVTSHAVSPQFTVKGGGWGHGIGMSQWGARGYALKGWKYDAITGHFYQGTRIVTKPTVTIRVNLDDGKAARSSWLIRAGKDSALTVSQTSNTSIKVTLDKTSAYWITTSGGNTRVSKDVYNSTTKKHSIGTVIKTFSGTCTAAAGGYVQIVGTSGPFNHSGIVWRGTIHFTPSTATTSKAVNFVDIEKYLYGVVPRESPSSWPAEALKAQAVAARSYAYQDGVEGNTLWCTTMSQVYNGHSRPGYAHEAASTNSAVDATKGKVVWYGSQSEPVQTFFMSSSGGHTANIEDVWTGSTPRPYYKGVSDADQDSPNYSWTVGPYSGSTLAAKIRDKDNGSSNTAPLDYSVPSPATITNVQCESAPSGYAHHVNLTWSNGAKFRILGTTFQSALGLKSTHMGVSRSYPIESSTRYQESSSNLAWVGRWVKVSSASASGGSQRSSSTGASSLTASFSGTGVKWIGSRGTGHGKAKVYVDGVYRKTVDLYASSAKFQQTLYSNLNLTPGSHTLKVVVSHSKNSASAGYSVPVDGIDVINGKLATALAPLVRHEQSDTHLARLGAWTTYSSTLYSGGSLLRTAEKAARVYATFYGSEVRWIGAAGPSYGKARVSVDGGPWKEISLTASSNTYGKTLFKRTGLSQDAAHTLLIDAVGTGSGGTNGFASVDAISLRGGWLLPASIPTVTVEQTSSATDWSGAWRTSFSAPFSNGSHRLTSEKNASCTFTFEGTSVAWIDKRAGNYGKARVYLDGVSKGVVDQYSATSGFRQTLWRSERLPCRKHTLRIVALRTKRAASSGYVVGVDAFKVSGRASTP